MWINYWPRINNNKKGGVLVFFLTREFTQDLFKKRESFFCQEIIICCLKNLKIKWNIKKKKGRKFPGSAPPKAAEIHSSGGEKQRWWARSRVTAAWEAAGRSCHFRSLAVHTHLSGATWIPSSRGGRPGYSRSIHATLWKEEGLCTECVPPSMQPALSNRAIIKKGGGGAKKQTKKKPRLPPPIQPQFYNQKKSLFLSLLLSFNHDNKHSLASTSSGESYSKNFTLITPPVWCWKELCW